MRARGSGGQHVNRTESAVRLTHEPSGITVSMQDSRSQHQNRTKAWEVLRARLLDQHLQKEASENRAMRRSQVASADRSERVRTYNFPQDRVTDHRIGVSLSDIHGFMDVMIVVAQVSRTLLRSLWPRKTTCICTHCSRHKRPYSCIHTLAIQLAAHA